MTDKDPKDNVICEECVEKEDCTYTDPVYCLRYWAWIMGGF